MKKLRIVVLLQTCNCGENTLGGLLDILGVDLLVVLGGLLLLDAVALQAVTCSRSDTSSKVMDFLNKSVSSNRN